MQFYRVATLILLLLRHIQHSNDFLNSHHECTFR